MTTLKRIFAASIAALLMGGILPAQSQNISTSIVSINAAGVTARFNPRAGQTAQIPYTVSGNTARGVTIEMYQMTGDGCRVNSQYRLRPLVQAPIDRTPGTYTPTWDGRSDGVIQPEGQYCFFLTWENPTQGVQQPLMGTVTVDYGAAAQPQPDGGAAAGDGNVVNAGNPLDLGRFTPVNFNGPLDITNFAPNPPIIKQAGTPSTLTVRYITNERLRTGYTVGIYRGLDTLVREVYRATGDIPAGTRDQRSWTPGCTVQPGIYNMQFRVPGTSRPVESLTNIVVESGRCPVIDVDLPPGPGDGGNLGTFVDSISTSLSGNLLTVKYRIRRFVLKYNLDAIAPSGASVASLANLPSIAAGNYSKTWDFTGFSSGTYTLRFRADRESTVDFPVFIPGGQLLPPNHVKPVISGLTADPARFPRGAGTFFQFNIDQPARAAVTVFRAGQVVKRVITDEGFANNVSTGVNRIFWNGRDRDGFEATEGSDYTVVVEAKNNSGDIADARSASFVIESAAPPVQSIDVTNVSIDPLNFNPEIGNATVRFRLNQEGYVTVSIRRRSSNEQIATAITDAFFGPGDQSVAWAPGATVSAGDYIAIVEARSRVNSTRDSEFANFSVYRTAPGSVMDVSNVFADPARFNPENQSARLTFTLSHPGFVTARVTDSNGNLVNELTSNQFFEAGSNKTVTWMGTYGPQTYQPNIYVPNGTYNFRIDAVSTQYGSDYGTGTVIVDRGGVSTIIQINNRGPNPNPFNPRTNAETVIDFSVTPNPSSVRVELYRSNGNYYVRDLPVDLVSGTSATYRARWNGRDGSGNIMSDDVYTYRITASASGQSATTSGTVTLTSGTLVQGTCGNFRDVPRGNSLCDAIEFVTSRGIFVGYPDGTLGLSRDIQRAELLAVMQKAFRYSLDPYNPAYDGDLGYKDLRNQTYQWYMPYVKTFARLGIMVGYPDRLMRPARTMSTAELYVVLLKSALRAPGGVAKFTLPPRAYYQPFADTPITDETLWYIRYAEFARVHGLVRSTKFYPAKGITRGQVIQLIYDLHRKNLVTFGPAIR